MPGAQLEERLRKDVELRPPCKASMILTEYTQHISKSKFQNIMERFCTCDRELSVTFSNSALRSLCIVAKSGLNFNTF